MCNDMHDSLQDAWVVTSSKKNYGLKTTSEQEGGYQTKVSRGEKQVLLVLWYRTKPPRLRFIISGILASFSPTY